MSKTFKKIVSLSLISTMVSGSIVSNAFANTNQELSQLATPVVGEVSIDNIIEKAKEVDSTINVSKDDIIIQYDELGNERFIVPIETTQIDVKAITISDMYNTLKDDPIIEEINLYSNILEYTFDDTNVVIIESIDENGIITWEVNEQGKLEVYEIDTNNNTLSVDGIEANGTLTKALVFQQDTTYNMAGTRENWHHYNTVYEDWHTPTGDAIFNLTVNAFFLKVSIALGQVGWVLGVAQIVMNFIIEIGSKTNALYSITNYFKNASGTSHHIYQAWYLDYRYLQHAHTVNWYE